MSVVIAVFVIDIAGSPSQSGTADVNITENEDKSITVQLRQKGTGAGSITIVSDNSELGTLSEVG